MRRKFGRELSIGLASRTSSKRPGYLPASDGQVFGLAAWLPVLERRGLTTERGGPGIDTLPDEDVDRTARTTKAQRLVLESRLRYHLRCLRKDAMEPELTSLERLALIRDRARRMREIRGTLRARLASGRRLP